VSWKPAAVVAVAVLMLTSAVSANDSTLRQHYGKAIGEVYRTRNHLTVAAFFGTRGSICREQIESESTGRRMTEKEVNAVLDEIAPKSDRGNFKTSGFRNIASQDNDSRGTFEAYDRLTITRIGPANEYRYVFIFYNSAECWQMDADKQ
jgi:hypothetical protein